MVRLLLIAMTVVWSFDMRRTDGSAIVKSSQHHVMFLLDGSLSMSATDVSPSRFARATSLIGSLVTQFTWTESSLIVFSWLPVIRAPWTHDSSGFLQILSSMTLGEFPTTENFLGTALWDALLLSLQQFAQTPVDASHAIVVISDGDSNKGYDPTKVLSLLQERNIPLYFLVLGKEGYRIGVDKTDLPIITSFDTETIDQFTTETNGVSYFNPTDKDIQTLAHTLNAQPGEYVTRYMPYEFFLNDVIEPWMIVFFALLMLTILVERVVDRRKI